MNEKSQRIRDIRLWLGLFVVGLVLSGLTAFGLIPLVIVRRMIRGLIAGELKP